MAFFDSLGKIAKTAADKTGDLVETGRLSAKISSQNSNIEKVKSKIGDYVWSQFEAGIQFDEQINALCAEIKGYTSIIDETKAEIAAIKEKDEKAESIEYRPEPSNMDEKSFVFCSECGKQNNLGDKFCQGCGNKLQDS